MGIASINPTTGETLKEFEPLSEADISEKLALAQHQFEQYRHTSYEQRSQWLHRAAQILEDRCEEFGRLMTLEMGKPLATAIAEVKKCAWVCRYYADHGADFLADQPVDTDAERSFVRYQPLGIILAVMPWNFPFWQVFRFAAPTLMAGNVGLLKHASNVPQCALAIEAVLQEAGFPEGAFQTLLIGADQVAGLLADDRVKAATLTGSEAAGASLAAAAGQQIKKTVLELGGSDPFVVLASADVSVAADTAVQARMFNNGQTCIAAKRYIVVDDIANAFEQRVIEKFAQLKVGDPLDSATDIGPLSTPSILQELTDQVNSCVEQGGKIVIGGNPSTVKEQSAGNFYPPTLITDLPPTAPMAKEELFGPVALLFRVPDLDAAIQLANDTSFGLGASAWAADPDERDRLVTELDAGAVFINSLVKSDPRLPFGGIKRSGYGRELGVEGIREFVNAKTVWIQ